MRVKGSVAAAALTLTLGVALGGHTGQASPVDCRDFATQEDAQAYFDANGGSPDYDLDNLDANGNGIACEWLPSADSLDQSAGDSTDPSVDGSADTSGDTTADTSGDTSADTGAADVTTLPDTGSGAVGSDPSILLPLLGIGGALGAAAARLRRR